MRMKGSRRKMKTHINALLEKAYGYRKEGKYNEALAALNEAILSPDITVLAFAYWERGRVYECIEKYDMALSDINEAVNLEPDLMDCILYDRISIYQKMGEYALAIRDYTLCVHFFESQPKTGEVYHFICNILEKRGNLYAIIGDLEKAKADYDKAAQIKGLLSAMP